ncbi:MAG: DUF4861 domain-containing protein [Bacteroidales bacterium]|nr:DUF4861 domain-containing protein [Bacteroidales bacterium]
MVWLDTILWVFSAVAQTDVYIKLYDHQGKHPRIESITYPGDANILDMYNSLYGHGAVIENPWVAYRIYMDNRQSLDLYVKQTPRLELDVTGFYTTPQQMEEGCGCDVLWAGKSVGAGSFRGWQNSNPVTIDSVASRTQTVIDSCTVEMVDRDWIYNGHPIQMTQRYTVSPDKRDLMVEIRLNGHLPSDIFCTGIQKLELDNRGFVLSNGVAASWGSNVPDKSLPDLVETVGLGIVVNPENVASVVEDDLNYLIFLQPDPHGIVRYRVISCGTREKEGFTNSEKWFEYISNLK